MSETTEQPSDLQLATRRGLAGIAIGDLAMLEAALGDRETLIAAAAAPQSGGSRQAASERALCERAFLDQSAALRDGQAIHALLTTLRSQIEADRDRLARFSATLAGSGSVAKAAIYLFG